MKRSALILFICLLIPLKALFAQKEANNWYFGDEAGLTFNSGTPVQIKTGKLNTQEGCAAISDKNGNLLFYTDGVSVWNKNNVVMPNGTALGGNYSATQSAIIVPNPGNSMQYYIFTVDAWAGNNPRSTGNSGVNLNLVDMTLNGGLGDVTTKDQHIITPTCEKITAARHCNGTDFWVVTHKWGSDSVAAFLLTATGLSAMPVISHSGVVMKNITIDSSNGANGYLKISPNGKKIGFACYSTLHTMAVGDFDNSTGVASNFVIDASLPFTPSPLNGNNSGPYGFAFSPDNSKVYVSSQFPFNIYQYDLSGGSANIVSSRTIIHSSSSTGIDVYGALQLAPDGNIYVAKVGATKLDAIENPNALGSACNYVVNGITVASGVRSSEVGLPNFIESFLVRGFQANFSYQDCNGANYIPFVDSVLSGPVTISWNFGDTASGVNNSSTLTNVSHTFSNSGTYTVSATITYACGTFTVSKSVNVTSAIAVSAGPDQTIFPGGSALLEGSSSSNGTYTWAPPTGLDNPTLPQPTASPTVTTVYTLTVSNSSGCTNSDSMTVFIDNSSHVYFPNAFTPNGDGLNDHFTYYTYNIKSIDLKIFNRWGQLIFESTSPDYTWDGTFNSKPEPEGTYVYEAQVVGMDGKQSVVKGNMTLIR